MKKCLLIASLAVAITANAQNRIARNVTVNGPATHASAMTVAEPSIVRSAALPSVNAPKHQVARKKSSGGNTAQTLCESQIGTAGNQFGPAFGPKTNLEYNRDLNTLVLIHRSNDMAGWPNTANILYDISTNGGVTWLNDQGPAYFDNTNVTRARYPQGGIYNPPGNTDPANAYATTFGIATDGTNWVDLYKGTTQTGTTTQVQGLYDYATYSLPLSTLGYVPQGGCVVKNTGETWWSAGGNDGAAYNDIVLLSHGVYNSTTHDFDYTFHNINVPVCTNNAGAKMYNDCAVTFNDAGTIGYIVVLGNDWVCNFDVNDSAYGMIVYKTTDSGNNWSRIHSPDPKLADPLLLNGGYAYMSSSQMDIGMDGSDHLHIVLPIVPFQPGNGIFLGYTYGSWGIFDVSSVDDFHYTACLVARPQTYYGDFGTAGSTVDPEIQEENRAQFSRSWDGTKVFYTYFDTDTATYGAGLNNFPDIHVVGNDLSTNLWTAESNFSLLSGLSCDGASTWGNVSYYTINDGTNENVPVAIDVMSNSTGEQIQFFYEGCGAMSNYVNGANCVEITGSLGLNDHSKATTPFSVSSNYPNPYTGKTSIDVSLEKVSDVTVEISNAIGQVLSSVTYKNLRSGVNTISIDGSSLSKGLYFYTVKAGSNTDTKTMSVE